MAEFDMELVQRGARNRRTPYYEAEQRHTPLGYTVYNHMYFPIRFDTFEAEFDALLNDVTVWDVSVERCLEISGPDGFRFAQLLTCRDLSKCAVTQSSAASTPRIRLPASSLHRGGSRATGSLRGRAYGWTRVSPRGPR